MKIISLESLSTKLKGGMAPILVESLPAKYFNDGHLPGALNINYDEVMAKAPGLLPDRDAEIVVYCASPSCQNSHKAAMQLATLGYRNVAVFAGGKSTWLDAGMKLEQAS